MKANRLHPKKTKAQAMVEFAIALPILLMLLYGILEAGRLLFLYSTVVTASRQAVRFGSTTGNGSDYTSLGGPNNSSVKRYQDCWGIRRAADRADFLNSFDYSDISIYYDTGPGTTPTPYCTGDADATFKPNNNNYRIQVEIKGDFNPIIPKLVPFAQRTVANGNPIKGISARTILVSISIVVTAPPSTWSPAPSPTFTFTPSSTPTMTRTQTQTPTATHTPLFTNTASRTPTQTLVPTGTSVTVTKTPTKSPTPGTPVACSAVSAPGTITYSGSTMTLSINNTFGAPVEIQSIFVAWNNDKGHQTGSDKTLNLLDVTLGSQIWNGNSNGPSQTITPAATTYLPTGTSTIVFTFHQSYDNKDGTEAILINFVGGCTIQKP